MVPNLPLYGNKPISPCRFQAEPIREELWKDTDTKCTKKNRTPQKNGRRRVSREGAANAEEKHDTLPAKLETITGAHYGRPLGAFFLSPRTPRCLGGKLRVVNFPNKTPSLRFRPKRIHGEKKKETRESSRRTWQLLLGCLRKEVQTWVSSVCPLLL